MSKNINKRSTPFDTGTHTKPVNQDNETKQQNDSKNHKQTSKRISTT